VFENGVLRRIFGPKRDEVTGEWRKLHNNRKYAHLCKYMDELFENRKHFRQNLQRKLEHTFYVQ
jgi:hypothetical protein